MCVEKKKIIPSSHTTHCYCLRWGDIVLKCEELLWRLFKGVFIDGSSEEESPVWLLGTEQYYKPSWLSILHQLHF